MWIRKLLLLVFLFSFSFSYVFSVDYILPETDRTELMKIFDEWENRRIQREQEYKTQKENYDKALDSLKKLEVALIVSQEELNQQRDTVQTLEEKLKIAWQSLNEAYQEIAAIKSLLIEEEKSSETLKKQQRKEKIKAVIIAFFVGLGLGGAGVAILDAVID